MCKTAYFLSPVLNVNKKKIQFRKHARLHIHIPIELEYAYYVLSVRSSLTVVWNINYSDQPSCMQTSE